MPDNEFFKGLKLETKEGKYGEYIRGAIDVEAIFQNPLVNNKWANFMMFKSKAGKWYAVQSKPQSQEKEVTFSPIDEDEIPF